jgi:hypothetical protein
MREEVGPFRSAVIAAATGWDEVARGVVPAIVVEVINDNFRPPVDQPSKISFAPMTGV